MLVALRGEGGVEEFVKSYSQVVPISFVTIAPVSFICNIEEFERSVMYPLKR